MYKWNTPEGLLNLTLDLVGQESISGTETEVTMAQHVYDILKEFAYFKENPEHLELVPLEDDPLGRNSVIALVKSKRKTDKTLLTVGHIDTVDVEDYNALQDICFKPYELTKRIGDLPLTDEVKADLESGSWLFGRGIMDMKAGVAWQMSLLERYMNDDSLEGNLLFMAVPDEEMQSTGVLAAIPRVNQWIEKFDLAPFAVLNTEPNFASYPGDDNKYIYLGTAGKLVAGFYFVGQECHVGESLSGLNVNLIASEFMRRLEISTEFSDVVGQEVGVPPTCLKYKDLKRLYSAQTPNTSVAYFSMQTLAMKPNEMLGKFTQFANEAMEDAMEKLYAQTTVFKNLSKLPVKETQLTPKVLLYDDLLKIARETIGPSFTTVFEDMITRLSKDTGLDERELNTAIISEVFRYSNLRGPAVILHFAPPYYPHVGLMQETKVEKSLHALADKLVMKAQDRFGEEVLKRKYHQGLTDLSYFALQDAEEVIGALVPNTPSWGRRYKFPVEEIRKLNLPVINFGPHGRDPHKYTERIELDYSFTKGPALLYEFIEDIFSI